MLKKRSTKILVFGLTALVLLWSASWQMLPALAEQAAETPGPEVVASDGQPEDIAPPAPAEEVDQSGESSGQADITTGDAGAVVDVDNRVNVNDNEVDADLGGCADNCEDLSGGEDLDDSQDSLLVSNDNQAEVDNQVDGQGNSGGNEADGNEADVNIDTGLVQIISNIFNLINVNFIGSNYLGAAYNLVGSILGDIDLSRYEVEDLADEVEQSQEFQEFLNVYQEQADGQGSEQADSQDQDEEEVEVVDINDVEITNDNQADVDNEVNLDANSGLNEALDNAGDVKIVTGDIFVASNLVNIVNTNIIGDGWTMTFINIMGDWSGDLVLPSLTNLIKAQEEDFSLTCDDANDCLEQLAELDDEAEVEAENSLVITNNNEANVSNEVEVVGNSGGNEVEGNDGDVSIETGDVSTVSQVYNQVNTNILDSGWVFGVVNVLGDWLGTIFGQPEEGFTVQDYGNYSTFSYNPNYNLAPDEPEEQASVEEQASAEPLAQVSPTESAEPGVGDEPGDESEVVVAQQNSAAITNNNSAEVNNVVKIFANSGGNVAAGNGGNVDIKTGDVSAVSNVLNLINSNIVGDDWTLAFINVLGSWQGNVQFGKPDLAVTEVAQPTPDPAEPGGLIDYVIVITNKGDAPATAVEVSADFDDDLVVPTELDGGEVVDGKVVWLVDKIGVGEIIVKHYQAQIKDEANNEAEVDNAAEAWGVQGDRNPDDNVAHTKVIVYGGGGLQIGWGYPVNNSYGNIDKVDDSVYQNPVYNQTLQIDKSNDVSGLVYRNQTVNYTIKLYNNSSESLYDVIVYDNLFAPDSTLVNQESWQLGEVFPYEEISIEYSVNFSQSAMPGEYRNLASADGFDSQGRYSIFPRSESAITLSDLDSQAAGNFVDIQYLYQSDKYLGSQGEESVVITNLAGDPLPPGQLVITFAGDKLSLAGETDGSLKYDIPEIGGHDNHTVQFDAKALALTDGDLVTLHYLTFGTPVASLTASYQIIDQPAQTEAEVAAVSQVDDNQEQEVRQQREPRVLGYALGLGGGGPILPQDVSSYWWQSLQDSLFTWWFWLGMVILALLMEIYHRYRKGDKFWEKTFGFRIF